jgi:hypothetical protein
MNIRIIKSKTYNTKTKLYEDENLFFIDELNILLLRETQTGSYTGGFLPKKTYNDLKNENRTYTEIKVNEKYKQILKEKIKKNLHYKIKEQKAKEKTQESQKILNETFENILKDGLKNEQK